MRHLRKPVCVFVLLSLLAFGPRLAWAQTTQASLSEVQALVTRLSLEGFPADEVVSAALELGYAPELIAAVLGDLGAEPISVVLAMVAEGVPRPAAAKSVIAAFGPSVAELVKQALLVSAQPDEVAEIEVAVAEGVVVFESISSDKAGAQPELEPEAELPRPAMPPTLAPQQTMGGGGTTRN